MLTSKMRILFLCHRFPYPPKEGGKIRSFNMIKHLGTQHQVVVAAPTRSSEELEAAHGISPYCDEFIAQPIGAASAWLHMIANVPSLRPSSFGYFDSSELKQKLDGLRAKRPFDLVVAHSSSVGSYVQDWSDTPKIIDFCDMDSQKWHVYGDQKPFPMSFAYWLEGEKT